MNQGGFQISNFKAADGLWEVTWSPVDLLTDHEPIKIQLGFEGTLTLPKLDGCWKDVCAILDLPMGHEPSRISDFRFQKEGPIYEKPKRSCARALGP